MPVINIFIKENGGKMSSLKVNTNDTVAEVMSLIKEKENIECDIQLHFM